MCSCPLGFAALPTAVPPTSHVAHRGRRQAADRLSDGGPGGCADGCIRRGCLRRAKQRAAVASQPRRTGPGRGRPRRAGGVRERPGRGLAEARTGRRGRNARASLPACLGPRASLSLERRHAGRFRSPAPPARLRAGSRSGSARTTCATWWPGTRRGGSRSWCVPARLCRSQQRRGRAPPHACALWSLEGHLLGPGPGQPRAQPRRLALVRQPASHCGSSRRRRRRAPRGAPLTGVDPPPALRLQLAGLPLRRCG